MAQITRGPGAADQSPSRGGFAQLARHPAIPGPHLRFDPPAEQTEPQVQAGRLAAIDVLRGGAMFLGIFIHAAISYLPSGLTELIWGIQEETTSPVLGVLFWWVHTFRLPLFFVIAGFFTLLVYDTKGPRAFVIHRARRLLVPLALGVALLLPMSYLFFWSCGVINGRVSDVDLWSFEYEPHVLANLFGPMHLWFLQDLLLLTLIALALWQVQDRLGGRQRSMAPWPAWASALAPFALSLPAVLVLWISSAPVISHRNTFVPDLPRLVYYGLFFAAGTALYRWRQLPRVFAWPCVHLALSLLATVGLLALLPEQLSGRPDLLRRLVFATCAALVAWLSIFGFMGLALRHIKGQHPTAHYLADASYWIYLCHMPLVCALQLNLFRLPVAPELKCAIILGITVTLGLLTYQTMVRYTVIGAFLHGPRTRSKAD
jgi:glucans biosynthesis protein C